MSALEPLLRAAGIAEPLRAAAEHDLREGERLPPAAMTTRQFVVEAVMATLFGLVATALALGDHSGFDGLLAVALVVVLAGAQRVEFVVGSGFGAPTQLVFVPTLFLLPAGVVPSLVAVAMVLARVPDFVAGRAHGERALVAVDDAWFAIGPAVVFVVAGVAGPDPGEWPIYLGALAAMLATDLLASMLRRKLAFGVSLGTHLADMRIIWLVDLVLAPLGFVTALAAADHGTYLVLLVLPLILLLRLFAQERVERLHQAVELSATYRRTAMLLGEIIGEDDEYTGLHSQGVVALSLAVADEMGLDQDQRRLVELGALLHDVGKIAMPDSIVNKPGPLDDDEWVVMKTHTIEGQRMLDRVGGVLHEVGLVVRGSHEHYDGSGYPDGLVGDEIPLPARIVSCADAWSAMTTDRPYRKSLGTARALQELRDNAGSQFDPDVVDATIRVVTRITGG